MHAMGPFLGLPLFYGANPIDSSMYCPYGDWKGLSPKARRVELQGQVSPPIPPPIEPSRKEL
ncbi:hypothetical protein PIB30_105185, partial [Stylosanthes scabra]|nr:hypothetical protein [Stylosanthes scabra]